MNSNRQKMKQSANVFKYNDVSVVIPNWNGMHLLEANLPAVVTAVKEGEIIVVDDGSTDGSMAFLKKNFPKVRIIDKNSHEGFSSTVNVGVAAAARQIVVLLNTDVKPEKDFLSTMLVHFSDPTVFAVGCLEKSIERGHIVFRGRGKARWEKGFFIHERGEVDKKTTAWVSGGSGAFRKNLWDQLGGMDPLFNPFYWEDIDLSYRAIKSGYRLVFENKSIVEHFHEQGKIKKEFSEFDVQRIAFRNQFIFIWKNCSDPLILLTHSVWTPVRLLQSLMRGDFAMLSGYLAAVLRVPNILHMRGKSSQFWKVSDTAMRLS